MDNKATAESRAMKGKNALFMALVSGLAQEAKRKKEMTKSDEREPSQEASVAIEVLARDAPSSIGQHMAVPGDEELEPMIGSEARMPPPSPSRQRAPIPPPAPAASPRNIHTPSPGQYHKMLSINKLAKEEPQHQIHAKTFREKAYIGPTRKVFEEATQPSVAAKEAPKQDSNETINVKCDDPFFAELKHRAALQNVTQSLLAENNEAAVASVILSNDDEVSALDSKSFESEKVSVKIQPDSVEIMSRPPKSVAVKAVEVKPVELPIKYLDVLPDDEKKDIVITNMKEFKAPLPFDEDGKAEVASPKSVQVETTENVSVEKSSEIELVKSVEVEADVQTKEAVDEGVAESIDACTETSTKSAANTKATTASFKSLKPRTDDDDEVRSFKSLPATFAGRSRISFRCDFKKGVEKHVSKNNGLGAITECNAVSTGQKDEERAPKGHTIAAEEAEADDLNDIDDEATASISIKEIAISSVQGDRSTALASISSKIEHQTRKLAELEAEALRKHKEAENAATDAREALERMLEAKSKEKAKKVGYSKDTAGSANGIGEDYKSVTSMSRRSNKRDVKADISLCSTWSEESRSHHGAARQKEAKGQIVHKSSMYSDASSSQYSQSFDESSFNDVDSYRECDNSSAYQEDRKVSEIRKKHAKKSYHTPSNKRSSTRGRLRGQTTAISTQRSRSASPVQISKKAPLLPSLMSPDPPSKQGKPRQRSHSQPRGRTSRNTSAKHDVLMSKSKRSNKPNHLLSYSSRRRSSETPEPTKATAGKSSISPETRQPVFARHESSHHGQPKMLHNEKPYATRHSPTGTHGDATISLAGYTSRYNVPQPQSQMGMSPQMMQQNYNHPYQYTPNMTSAPISLAGYTRREESSHTPSIPMRPTTGNMFQYSGQFGGASNFSHATCIQTPQQTSAYAMRPYSAGQILSGTQYQSQQQMAGFHNTVNRGRVNQYSMLSGGELL